MKGLDAKKPVIYCGDLNVAHKETGKWNIVDSKIKHHQTTNIVLSI
jgi:exonuclease III